MKKLVFSFFIFAFLNANLFSQVTREWVDLYANNYGKALAVDGAGNVCVTGWGWGNGYNTIKYNSSGVQQWLARYRGTDNANDFAFSIAVDAAGNVYVTGWSQGGGNATDIVTVKYDSNGDSLWVQRYRGPDISNATPGFEPYLHLITLDNSGNVYVAGTSYGGASTYYDYAVIKYNSSGVQQWVRRYNNPASNKLDYATAIAVDASGNVYVSGFSDADTTATVEDFCTIKYSSNGVQQWVERYNNGAHNRVNGMTLDNLGNIYVAGWGGPSTINGPGGYLTVKYNNSGVQQWAAAYPGATYDEASSLVLDMSGNIFVTGGINSGSGSNDDYVTIKYSSSGVQQWLRQYNGSANGYDKANSIAVDKLGDVYITGTSNNGGTAFDYATVKYSNSGVQQWAERYNETGTANCSPLAIVVDTSYNFYLTGSSGAKYMTIKYSQLVGIKPTSQQVPLSFSLSQNYPNPFNPVTKIKFDIAPLLNQGGVSRSDGVVRLVIYDLLGREIETLINEKLSPGTYGVEWNGSNFPSGVYFYKLTAEDFSQTKKLVLLK